MPFRHFFVLVVLFLSVTAPRNCDAQTAEKKPLGNQDIIDLLKAGLTPEVVVAKIKASVCNFDTSPASLKELKSAAVPDYRQTAHLSRHHSASARTEAVGVVTSRGRIPHSQASSSKP